MLVLDKIQVRCRQKVVRDSCKHKVKIEKRRTAQRKQNKWDAPENIASTHNGRSFDSDVVFSRSRIFSHITRSLAYRSNKSQQNRENNVTQAQGTGAVLQAEHHPTH